VKGLDNLDGITDTSKATGLQYHSLHKYEAHTNATTGQPKYGRRSHKGVLVKRHCKENKNSASTEQSQSDCR
jgi:hypothetical protein